jgi:cell division protein FtsW
MDLHKKIFKGDGGIWTVYFCFCVLSIMEVFSATSTLTYKSGDIWGPITQHCIYLLMGTVIVVLVHNIPCKWFRVIPPTLGPISIVLLLMVTVTGEMTNGAKRWIDICGIQFQPSELGKMALVVTTALILSRMQTDKGANPKAFKYILGASVFVCGLIFRENGSTALLLFSVIFMMMIIGRVPFRQWSKIVLVGLGVIALFVGTMKFIPTETLSSISRRLPTMQSRVNGFFEDKSKVSPQEYDIDKNAQVAHANIAISRGNIIGRMPGNSVERDFLSQAFSDFIFAIVLEELGLAGGVAIVLLYVILMIRVSRIAKKSSSYFASFLIMGLTLLLVTQAAMNISVAVGMVPVTGQPLPFISKGGTSTFINSAYIGMILSVSRYILYKEERASKQQALIEASPSQAKAIREELEQTRQESQEMEDEEEEEEYGEA